MQKEPSREPWKPRRVAPYLPAQLLNKVHKFVIEDPLQSFRGFWHSSPQTLIRSFILPKPSNSIEYFRHTPLASEMGGKSPVWELSNFYFVRRLLCHAACVKVK
jgi:hypothetical protein